VWIVYDGLRRSKGTDHVNGYFLADRSLPWWVVGLSVMATQMSAVTIVGTTGQAYATGLRFIQFYFGLPLAMVLLSLTVVPFFARARVYTAYEFLIKGEFRSADGAVIPDQHSTLLRVLQIGTLCNDAGLVSDNGSWTIKGDPTEGALIVASAKAGLDIQALSSSWTRVGEIPFSSERMRMTTIHETPEGRMALSKGAVEIVINSCSRICLDGHEKELLPADMSRALEANRKMGEDGLRVLALAYRTVPESAQSVEETERDMVFAGGSFRTIGSQPRDRLAALDAKGDATSWRADVLSTNAVKSWVNALAVVGPSRICWPTR
jgi:magnesium-transporting ATPase (P-type)